MRVNRCNGIVRTIFSGMLLLAVMILATVGSTRAQQQTAAEQGSGVAGFDVYVFLDETGNFEGKSFRSTVAGGIQATLSGLLGKVLPEAQTNIGLFGFGSKGVAAYDPGSELASAQSGRWLSQLARYGNGVNAEIHDSDNTTTNLVAVAAQIAQRQNASRADNRVPIILLASDFVHAPEEKMKFAEGGRCNDSAFRLSSGDLSSLRTAQTNRTDRLAGVLAVLNQTSFPSAIRRGKEQECFRSIVQTTGVHNAALFADAVSPASVSLPVEQAGSGTLGTLITKAIGRNLRPEQAPTLTKAELHNEEVMNRLSVTLTLPANVLPVRLERVGVFDGSRQLFVKSYPVDILPKDTPDAVRIQITEAEYRQILEGGNVTVRAFGALPQSGTGWETYPLPLQFEQPPALILRALPPPRLTTVPQPSSQNAPPIFQITGLRVDNPANIDRLLKDVVLVSAEDSSQPVLTFPIRPNRTIPARKADVPLEPITLDADQFQRIQAIRDLRVAVTLTESATASGTPPVALVRSNLPASQLRIVNSRLAEAAVGRITVEVGVVNPGPLPATITAASLSLPGDRQSVVSDTLEPIIVAPGRATTPVRINFTELDVATYLNSSVAELQIRLTQSNGPQLDSRVDVRIDPKGLQIVKVTIPETFSRTNARVTFEIRNNRKNLDLNATVKGVRAYPNGGALMGIFIPFEKDQPLQAGNTATVPVHLTNNDIVQQLVGRIVEFSPVEERDEGRTDIYDSPNRARAALASVSFALTNLSMRVGPVRPPSGTSPVAEATVFGQANVLGVDDVPRDVLARAELKIALTLEGMETGAFKSIQLSALRTLGTGDREILTPFTFELSRQAQLGKGDAMNYDDLEKEMSVASLETSIKWADRDAVYAESMKKDSASIFLSIGNSYFGIQKAKLGFSIAKYASYWLFWIFIVVIVIFSGHTLYFYIKNGNPSVAEIFKLLNNVRGYIAGISSLIAITMNTVIEYLYFFLKDYVFVAYIIILISMAMFIHSIVYAKISPNKSTDIVPMENRQLKAFYWFAWIVMTIAAIFVIVICSLISK